ncbi:MAG TPA: efflux RND transporter periplasmic adaptor subunit [Chitinophagaceae bacterium]|nr:efflux RND transporter periplasmic adaptor subunit [Chitinophagaceae bacterium]
MSINRFTQALFYTSAILFAAGCTAHSSSTEIAGPAELPVFKLSRQDTVLFKDYVTDIQAIKNVEIRARVQGFLEKINVDEGQTVKKGEVLFQINDEEYVSALAKAKANVTSAIAEAKAASLEVGRTKILVDKNVVTHSELDLAEARLKAANAKIEEAKAEQQSAETKLSYTEIRSPFDGVIDRIPLKTGSLVDPGSLLTTISDISEVYAYFNVSESEYLQYEKKMKEHRQDMSNIIQLVLADGTSYPYKGKIETLGGEFDDNTGSIAFRARFSNPEKLLKHGASGKVRLTTEEENVILVPQKSVFEIQDKSYVFLVDTTNNKVTMRGFKPRVRIDKYYIVQSGLKPGDEIVYEGVQNLRDGAKIKPLSSLTDSVLIKQ